MNEITTQLKEFYDAVALQCQNLLHYLIVIVTWKYFWHVVFGIVAVAVIALVFRGYRKWDQGWLSEIIERRLRELRKKKRSFHLAALSQRLKPWYVFRTIRSGLFSCIRGSLRYSKHTLPTEAKVLYLPSLTSLTIVLLSIAFFFIVPQYSEISHALPTPADGWRKLFLPLAKEDAEKARKVFETLGIVVIALIIFVAESIRDVRNRDRKRVLLKISNLWPLGVAITLVPFGFLWGEITNFFLIFEMLLAAVSILALAKIIGNLISADTQAEDRRIFLKDRVPTIILDSVRERIGNNILLGILGADK